MKAIGNKMTVSSMMIQFKACYEKAHGYDEQDNRQNHMNLSEFHYTQGPNG